MSKKFLSILLAIVMVISIVPIATFAEEDITSYLTYEINDGEVTITNCDESISGDIVIPDTIEGYPVTILGFQSFYECSGLTNVSIPDCVTLIDEYAFYNCNGLMSLEIPDSVLAIGWSAFANCESLENVIIGNSVETIGRLSFSDCNSLTTITIPASVTSIAVDSFESCDSLTSITVDTSNEYYSSDEYGVLFNKDKTELMQYPTGNSRTEYAIPDSVTYIDDSAFMDCNSLNIITIPDGVTSIEDYTFMECSGLTTVNIPDRVTSIGTNAFSSCSSLTTIAIPASVTYIADGAFMYCNSLTSITVDTSNKYYSSDEYGVLFNIDKTKLIQYPAAKVADYVIPDSVKEFGWYSFNGAEGLKSIVIGSGLTEITGSAFAHCTGLKEVTISDSVTTIGMESFSGCNSLTNITIPNSVTELGWYSFGGCTSLKSVTFNNSGTINLDMLFFGEEKPTVEIINVGKNITELESSRLYYMTSEIESIKELNVDEDNKTYSSVDGVLFNKDKSTLMWMPRNYQNISYVIPESVKTIGSAAFSKCNWLTALNIPDSVTRIDEYAFFTCYNLKHIALSDNLTSIGNYAFWDCNSLEDVELLENLISIGDRAFYSCEALKDLTIPSNIESIGEYVYSNTTVENVTISDGVDKIGRYAFESCIFLDTATIYCRDVIIGEKALGHTNILVTGDKNEFSNLMKELMIAVNEGNTANVAELQQKVLSMCTIYDEPQPDPNFTIYGYKGSTAETYANENNLKFVPICEHNYVDTVITPATYLQTGEGGEVCEHCGDVKSTYEIPCLEIEDSVEEEDKDTGVSVIFPDGAFEDADVEIEVTPVEEGDAYKLISHKEGNYKVTMFDISITADGEKVQPNGTVLVKIPLPRGYNQNKCVVYYVADDGTMEELKTYHYKDGYVYFETDHFSYYAVLEEETTEDAECVGGIKGFIEFIKSLFERFVAILKSFLGVVA